MKNCKYSIIIVTYNSENEIHHCINSVKRNTCDYEIIVVDNASKDKTLEHARGGANIIANENNRGYSAAINQGIRASKGDYIIALNPDTVVYPFWADKMQEHFEPHVGAVGPVSTNVIGYQSMYCLYPNLKGFSLDYAADTIARNTGWGDTKLLIGFCMMIPRVVINDIGMMDESLFLGNDDLDYCFRLRYSGYSLRIAYNSFIDHKLQRSFASNPKSKELVQESTNKLYKKLYRYFGGKVPSPMELWGIDWFKPNINI
jgi:O-antigen biosynthesis protein